MSLTPAKETANNPTAPPTANAAMLIACAAFFALAAFIRFYHLGAADFWYDESCTHIYVAELLSDPDWMHLLRESTNLPYYFFARAWTCVFGSAEADYRSLSVAASLLALPLIADAARRLHGPATGLIAVAIAAVHPLSVYYAREARAYSLWILLLTACLWLLIRAVQTDRLRWWSAYAAVAVLALHTHYFTILWLPATTCLLLIIPQKRPPWRTWLITHALIVAAFVPYALAALLPAAQTPGRAWIAESFNPATALLESLWVMLPGAAYPPHLRGLSLASPDTVLLVPQAIAGLAMFLPAALLAMAVILIVARKAWTRTLTTLTGLAIAPLILALLVSLTISPVYLPGRYDVMALPAMLILTATLVDRAAVLVTMNRAPLVAALATATLILCSAIPAGRMIVPDRPPTFHHRRAERLAALTNSGDVAVVFSYDREYIAYYLDRAGFEGTMLSFPTWPEDQVGWIHTPTDFTRLEAGDVAENARRLADRLRQATAAGHNAFLVADFMELRGPTDRSAINDVLRQTLRARGFTGRPADASFAIHRILPPP